MQDVDDAARPVMQTSCRLRVVVRRTRALPSAADSRLVLARGVLCLAVVTCQPRELRGDDPCGRNVRTSPHLRWNRCPLAADLDSTTAVEGRHSSVILDALASDDSAAVALARSSRQSIEMQ